MGILPSNLIKYQRQRSVSGPWQLEGHIADQYDACVVIPALCESSTLPLTLNSLAQNSCDLLSRTLIVVVVNQRLDADESTQIDNYKTLEMLQRYLHESLNVAYIDACSPGLELPSRQGVGLARKIGFDLSLSLLNWSKKPLLISLDADTLVNRDYLNAIFSNFKSFKQGAAVIPFYHQPAANPAQEKAIRRYELYLRSYVLGLHLAGSPYAYASIGSAFACTANAYLQAGGMNRRQAGEDFYFLQQLAKTCGVAQVKGALVYPSSRPSQRVPFGTGRAVSSQSDNGVSPFSFCDKSSFHLLRGWFSLVFHNWRENANELLLRANDLDSQLSAFLVKLNFKDIWTQLQTNHSEYNQFVSNFHCWFDSLRTRQLLTSLSRFESGSELEVINELFHWGGLEEKESATEQLRILEQLQGVQSRDTK